MMVAAADPEDTGPIVINGAPMSYWGGAWQDGAGDNPMRYAGGNLGGTWLSSLTADLGNGVFDGAYLVENFENLNPANTFWDKYYNLYANVDTEPPRFLEFERWWGGFFLMNREEIEWITRNLFVGNKLWTGETKMKGGKAFDLRDIKAPIVLFASMGDNITPPQQAFNWVADVYGSTDEIKARGQVIVGLLHEDIGHLGIFVSGKVAKKEHAQIVSVLKSIETLPPGLYAMSIKEHVGRNGKPEYEVEFMERSLEEIAARLNRFERADEQPFEAVAAISDFNQRAYELFVQPFVQSMSNEFTAKMRRQFHPLRAQRWALSDLNPWLELGRTGCRNGPRAAQAGCQGQHGAEDGEGRLRGHQRVARVLPAMRDAASEARVLPHLRQCVLALHRRQGGSRSEGRTGRGRTRVAVREGGARLDRRGRLFRGGRARGVPAGAQGRTADAVAPADAPAADQGVRTSAAAGHARRVAPYPRRAGNHRPLRARAGDGDLARSVEDAGRPGKTGCAGARAAGRRTRAASVRGATGDDRQDRHHAGRQARKRRCGSGRVEAGARRRRLRARPWLSGAHASEANHGPTSTREVPTPDRLLPGFAADTDGRGPPVRREFAAGRRRRRQAGPDRTDPRRPEGQDPGGGEEVRHRHQPVSDRRRGVQPGLGRQGGRTGPVGQGRSADERQPAHRRTDGGGRQARHRAAHRAPGQPLLRDGRAVLCGDPDRHRCGREHRADDGGQGRHHPERHRTRARAALPRSSGGDPVGDGDRQSEGAIDRRGRRTLQDGRPRPDHRSGARRPARARQRDQPRVGEDQEDRLAGGRPRQRACRARSRGRQHARQEPVIPGRARMPRASCSARASRSS